MRSKLAALNIIPQEDNICILCLSHQEFPNHLLLHCDFSQMIWSWWLSLWGIKWVFPLTLIEAFEQWIIYGKNSFFKKAWVAIFSIIMWSIWKERNARIFCNKQCSVAEIQDMILLRLSWWIKGWSYPFPYSSEDILINPRCLLWAPVESRVPCSTLNPNQSCDWSPPPVGSLKWNVDASLVSSLSRFSIGGVLRDSNGVFKCVFSKPVPFIEINSAEVLAIFRASQIALAMDFFKNCNLIIESD